MALKSQSKNQEILLKLQVKHQEANTQINKLNTKLDGETDKEHKFRTTRPMELHVSVKNQLEHAINYYMSLCQIEHTLKLIGE